MWTLLHTPWKNVQIFRSLPTEACGWEGPWGLSALLSANIRSNINKSVLRNWEKGLTGPTSKQGFLDSIDDVWWCDNGTYSYSCRLPVYSRVGLDQEILVKAPKKCQPTGDLGILFCQKHYLKQGTLNTYRQANRSSQIMNWSVLSILNCMVRRIRVPCPAVFPCSCIGRTRNNVGHNAGNLRIQVIAELLHDLTSSHTSWIWPNHINYDTKYKTQEHPGTPWSKIKILNDPLIISYNIIEKTLKT